MAGTAPAALRKLERGAKAMPRKFVEEAIKDGRKTITKQLRGDTGGDAVLSNCGGKLSVKTKISGATIVTGELVAGPTAVRAQWFWLEEGTKAHRLGKRGSETRGESPLHPGSRAKRTWSKAVEPLIPRLVDDAATRFKKVFV